MLNEKILNQITDQVVAIYKKSKQRFAKESDKLTEYHPTYLRSVEMREAIAIHAIPGTKPDKLISERAPNQTDQEFNYAVKNYQQTTTPVFMDTVNTMQRAFSPNNWYMDYKTGEGEVNEFQQYLEVGMKSTPVQMDYFSYMFHVFTTNKLIDSQGVTVYKPYFIPTIETAEGEIVIDGERKFEPIPKYYPCDALVAYEESRWYMFLTDEKSPVEYASRVVNEGLVFEIYDDFAIYRRVQYGKQIDWTFRTEIYYVHDLGYCPVDRLKGLPADVNGEILYQSQFLFAVPLLNDVIIDSIMLRSIKAASVFPYRVMTGNICENTMEINGEVQHCDGTGWFQDFSTGHKIACSNCLGTGLKDRISPHGVLLLKPETTMKEGELKTSQPAMYYVEPTINTPQFLRTEIDSNLVKARSILHLKTTDTQVTKSTDLTATGAMIDEKALISVVKMFRDQVAESVRFGVKTMGRMRNGAAFVEPEFIISATIDLKSRNDYMMEISEAIKNGLPKPVVFALILDLIKTEFYNTKEQAGIFSLIIASDRLLVMTADEIEMGLAKGNISAWEKVLHDSSITLIRSLLDANVGYLEQDLAVQKEQLMNEARRIADAAKVSQPTSATSVVDSVLANIGA